AGSRDLTQVIVYGRRDEVGTIAASINALLAAMREALGGIGANTRQVAAASGQASTAIGQISDGARTQLDAFRQISIAMGQTSAAVNDVAHNAGAASASARQAAGRVDDGKRQIAEVVLVVRAIADNSKKINQIADIITRIAAQTNMLSLNAAIEAARAGEHGKGFAVVAEEVRKLADTTSASASQIGALVQEAVKEAERGVELVDDVRGGMERIVVDVRDSDALVQRIAAAIAQQSASIEEITANLASLGRIGEANASAAEEITSTMVELARLADQTRLETARFHVG
ncbi:MAG: methyl-accepting chemotaxis protein, partial [Rhodospirillales bacterium]|nr:methyl-accepting chemotaxis protein [Rhodospirillales bacterium]